MASRLRSLSPTAWLTIEKLTQQILWLVLFAVLAPILGPRPYGLFSITMVFIGLCELVLHEGAVEALTTVDKLERGHTGTANLCNGALATAASLVVFALAPLIAYVFGDPELKGLLWALTPLPIVSSLMATPVAVLRRSMQFKPLAIRSIVGLTVGGLLGVVLAIEGAGVWSLAFQVLAQRVCEFVILWLSVPSHIRFTWSRPHYREMARVARNVYISRSMSFIGGQMPRIIVGYVLGLEQLGLFTLANRILDIITQVAIQPRAVIGRVEMRLLTPGTPAFEGAFRSVIRDVATLSFPLMVGGAAITPDLFSVWLDHRWADGVLPTQLVLLSGVPMMLYFCASSALLAAKHSGSEARINAVQTLTLAGTVALTAPFGLNLTCWALLIRPAALLPLPFSLLRSLCKLPLRTSLLSPLVPLVGALLMAAIVFAGRRFFLSLALPEIPSLVGLMGLGAIVYLLFLQIFTPKEFRGLLSRIFAT